jgi:hypothetical protein
MINQAYTVIILLKVDNMRMGLKQRRILVNKRMRKISVDRESIFNKLLVTQKSLKEEAHNVIAEEDEGMTEEL